MSNAKGIIPKVEVNLRSGKTPLENPKACLAIGTGDFQDIEDRKFIADIQILKDKDVKEAFGEFSPLSKNLNNSRAIYDIDLKVDAYALKQNISNSVSVTKNLQIRGTAAFDNNLTLRLNGEETLSITIKAGETALEMIDNLISLSNDIDNYELTKLDDENIEVKSKFFGKTNEALTYNLFFDKIDNAIITAFEDSVFVIPSQAQGSITIDNKWANATAKTVLLEIGTSNAFASVTSTNSSEEVIDNIILSYNSNPSTGITLTKDITNPSTLLIENKTGVNQEINITEINPTSTIDCTLDAVADETITVVVGLIPFTVDITTGMSPETIVNLIKTTYDAITTIPTNASLTTTIEVSKSTLTLNQVSKQGEDPTLVNTDLSITSSGNSSIFDAPVTLPPYTADIAVISNTAQITIKNITSDFLDLTDADIEFISNLSTKYEYILVEYGINFDRLLEYAEEHRNIEGSDLLLKGIVASRIFERDMTITKAFSDKYNSAYLRVFAHRKLINATNTGIGGYVENIDQIASNLMLNRMRTLTPGLDITAIENNTDNSALENTGGIRQASKPIFSLPILENATISKKEWLWDKKEFEILAEQGFCLIATNNYNSRIVISGQHLTMYKTNEDGNLDDLYKPAEVLESANEVASSVFKMFKKNYNRKRMSPGIAAPRSSNTTTPEQVRSDIISTIYNLSDSSENTAQLVVLDDGGLFKNSLTVTQNTTDLTKAGYVVSFSVKLMLQVRSIITNISFTV